jgi:hypothetical protein
MTPAGQTRGMNTFRSPWSIAVTVFALVLIAIGVGGFVAGQALASNTGFGPPWAAGAPWHNGGPGFAGSLPPELSGLADVPADQRFAHFRGVQVSLTDKDGKPVSVNVTPGTVSSISASSITINGNDAASHTYTLDATTMQHGDTAKQNDKVVVATLNGSSSATAVITMNGNGFGPRGPWGR